MANRRFNQPWAQCGTCGINVPVSRIRRHPRWGWQCVGPPGAGCWDGLFDREEALKRRRFPLAEGVRRTAAPVTNTVREGVDDGDET